MPNNNINWTGSHTKAHSQLPSNIETSFSALRVTCSIKCLKDYSFEETTGEKFMEPETTLQPLISIAPAAQNNINAKFILLDKGRVTLDGQNKICLSLVADETAAVHFQLWGDECEAFEPGDIILLSNGIFSYGGRNNNHVLRAGKRGKAEKVGEFTMGFVETPNLSEILWAPDPNDSRKYVQQAVISPYSRIFRPIN